MKYKFHYLLLLSFLLFMAACSGDESENIPTPPEKAETYLVSLNLSGDIDVAQEPLTRGTATNDLYGINVYYSEDGTTYKNYAYGLFDNKEDMTIELLSGYQYKFACTLVKNGKQSLYYGQAFGNTYSGYCYPFQTNSSNSTMLSNSFILGSTYLEGIGSGYAHLSSLSSPSTSNYTQYPGINRFYGETSGYTPTKGGQVTIELKRTVFGAKFNINGVQEGSVIASCGALWSQTTTTDVEGTATVHSFNDVSTCWSNGDSHSLTLTVNVKYTSDRGEAWDLSNSLSVTFKRNVLTTVNINVSPDLSSAALTLTEEEMSDEENYIDLGINTDGVIDTVVNPTE